MGGGIRRAALDQIPWPIVATGGALCPLMWVDDNV
jgi:hypothetical protein